MEITNSPIFLKTVPSRGAVTIDYWIRSFLVQIFTTVTKPGSAIYASLIAIVTVTSKH